MKSYQPQLVISRISEPSNRYHSNIPTNQRKLSKKTGFQLDRGYPRGETWHVSLLLPKVPPSIQGFCRLHRGARKCQSPWPWWWFWKILVGRDGGVFCVYCIIDTFLWYIHYHEKIEMSHKRYLVWYMYYLTIAIEMQIRNIQVEKVDRI